jgi:hypothetical protein
VVYTLAADMGRGIRKRRDAIKARFGANSPKPAE